MVDWPLVPILYSPVTHCNSHELVALMVLAFDDLWELKLGLKEVVDVVLSYGWYDIVGTDLLLHLAVVNILVHGALSDRNHCLDHIP